MYIMSTDKKTIINTYSNGVVAAYESDSNSIKYLIDGKKWMLGRYDSNQRALEVMEDIRDALQIGCSVFQMPEE